MTAGYVTFEGRIEPLVWGSATYTILGLPSPVMDQLGRPKRVDGEMNEHPVNLAPTRAPVLDDAFLWAGQALLDRIHVGIGEVIEVRLRPADPDLVAVDDDIMAALRAADAMVQWDQLTPGKQRGLLHQVATAKTQATRSKRIANLIAGLAA
jgi:hypothetical protein